MDVLDMPRLMRLAMVSVLNKSDPATNNANLAQLALHLGQQPPKA